MKNEGVDAIKVKKGQSKRRKSKESRQRRALMDYDSNKRSSSLVCRALAA